MGLLDGIDRYITSKKVQMSCLVMAGSSPLSLTHPSSMGTAASLMLPYMRPASAGLVCTCPAMAGFRAATPEMLMVRGPVVYTPAWFHTLISAFAGSWQNRTEQATRYAQS